VKIDIKNLAFQYNHTPVLKDVNLSFGAGECVAVIGPNGAGKSTLLQCINRILEPTGGSIILNDRNISEYSTRDVARKIGYVPQNEKSFVPTRVFCTVIMGRRPYFSFSPGKTDIEKTAGIIELLGLGDISKKDINKLSGGQRQKVYIARALVQEPEILLLDEPTANLDIRHQLEIMSILKEQSQRGTLVIAVIHDLNIALRYADRIVILHEGRVFADGGCEVINDENILKVYGVRSEIYEDKGRRCIIPGEPGV